MSRVFPFFASSSNTPLGPLERQMLEALWTRGNATVRELLEDEKITQAYTTVMTTLDRLYKKGLLDRIAEGRAFRYSPRQTPEELQRVAAVEGIRQLLGSSDTTALPLSYLVEAVSSHDAQLLDELQTLVERKRRARKKEERGEWLSFAGSRTRWRLLCSYMPCCQCSSRAAGQSLGSGADFRREDEKTSFLPCECFHCWDRV